MADIVVVGGGLNGATLALALAQAGLSSVVIDALPVSARTAPDFDGRAYALALASRRMLAAIGVWDRIVAQAQPVLEVKASDGRAGEGAAPFFLHFHHGELEEGPMGHIVEDRVLRAALMEAMAAEPLVTHLAGERVVAQAPHPAGIRLSLASGGVVEGRLAAGCDGRGSGTATRAGIGRMERGYGQTALVCAIAHERPHQGIAHQFFMPPGPLAILPLPGNRCSIVWAEKTDVAIAVQARDDAGYLEALRPRFGEFLGEIRLEGARFVYPLGLSLAYRFAGARVALVGDAAHGLHPIAGQGLNLGLRDVAALAEVLAEAVRRGEDPGSTVVLDRYQRWRRFDSILLAMATDGFNRLFSNDNPVLRGLRDLGMGMVTRTPALRRSFMREAAGLTGDLPRLLRGQRL